MYMFTVNWGRFVLGEERKTAVLDNKFKWNVVLREERRTAVLDSKLKWNVVLGEERRTAVLDNKENGMLC